MIQSAALFVFPWDFMDEGVDGLVGRAVDLGVTHLILVSHYHAGYFLYTHNPKRKVHLLEDGVAYFWPDDSAYADGPIRPKIAQMCTRIDWFDKICRRATAAGLKMIAWTVFCHNTRIGLEHPQAAICNVFGDIYPHALSPGHPHTEAFARGLVADLAKRYPLDAIFLEARDYRKRRHGGTWVSGHHHERDGVHLRELESMLMDISFNQADIENASKQGVDMKALQAATRNHLEQYFTRAPDEPTELPATVEAFGRQNPALADYQRYIRQVESDFMAQLRGEAQPHGVKLLGGLDPAVDLVMVGAYGLSCDDMVAAIRRVQPKLTDRQSMAVLLRMGFYSPDMGTPILSQAQMEQYVQTAADEGAEMIGFYNYAEAPLRSVQWIKPALARLNHRA
jgi:hypothetical protein